MNNLIIGNLNVHHLPSRFDELKCVIQGRIDLLILTETKLDESFPTSQFLIDGFSTPYRQDRNINGGGILIYIRKGITSRPLNEHTFPDVQFDSGSTLGPIEGMFIEINLKKVKWLLFGTYHRPKQNDEYYFDQVTYALDKYVTKYDKLLLAGDFNAKEEETVLGNFLYQNELKNLVKEPTCYKSVENPSCIDLLLTSPLSFQKTSVVNIGCSDFHKMSVTVLKTKVPKLKPKEVNYRYYKNFVETDFKHDLKNALRIADIDSIGYGKFEDIFLKVLDIHAPVKKKIIRGNHVPYMNKTLRKATMKRT